MIMRYTDSPPDIAIGREGWTVERGEAVTKMEDDGRIAVVLTKGNCERLVPLWGGSRDDVV